jgi:hypothetical protein
LFTVFCRLPFLVLALAVAPTVMFAGDPPLDHGNVKDLIGSWLATDTGAGSDGQPSVLATFHNDGTVSADVRGDVTGFPLPIFVSPEHGVWKKTGDRTFTVTFLGLEYNQDNTLYAIFEVDANFRLYPSGDQYDSNYVAYETLPNGQVNNLGSGTSHGVRITLKPPDAIAILSELISAARPRGRLTINRTDRLLCCLLPKGSSLATPAFRPSLILSAYRNGNLCYFDHSGTGFCERA